MIAQLTNHLWQSTVFCLAVALTAYLLRPNRAHVRYALWFAASVKFFVPFSLLVSLGALVPIRTAPPASTPVAPGAFSITVDQLTQPFPEIAPPAPAAPSPHLPWMAVAFAIWFAMFAAVVVIRLRAWRRIRHAVQAGVPLRLNTGDTIDVRSSSTTLEPGVVGLWRPILLVPDRITERLTPRQLETVVAHELCHVRRRDNLTAAVHMGVEAVCWFHPLVWWIGARLVAERERACDEAVLEQGLQPRDYADAILNVCKLCAESPLACVAGVTGSNLRKRIDDIMTERTGAALTFVRKAALSAVTIAALAAPLAVGSITAPLRAQTRSQSQRFEVASIKPCDPSTRPQGRSGGPGQNLSPDRLHIACMSVVQLINVAYITNGERLLNDDPGYLQVSLADNGAFIRSGPERIRGGPAWAHDEKFEIEAKASAQTDRNVMQGAMLRALLEERFHLKIHRAEDQNLDMFALTVLKGGPKIKPWATEDECTQWDRATQKPPPMKDVIEMVRRGEKPPCGLGVMGGENGSNRTLALNGQQMDNVAYWLSTAVGRHVIDRTGLTGKYTLYLEYAPEDSTADAAGPSVFKAVEEQWGLKLEPTKGPRGYIAIDNVERPSAGSSSQSVTDVPKWDAVSIKRCISPPVRLADKGGAVISQSPDRLTMNCLPVSTLINVAYTLNSGGRTTPPPYPVPIERLPSWADSERYTIEAKSQENAAAGIMRGPMLQALLEDRFALKIHRETREGRVYMVTAAKGGLKLQAFGGGCTPVEFVHPAATAPQNPCLESRHANGPNITIDIPGMDLDSFLWYLGAFNGSARFDGPVLNKTGLTGYFHFHLEFLDPSDPNSEDAQFPPIITALEQQLGLKVEAGKGPHQYLVVDRLERPTPN
jgi:uncharacterized protein (TIGR03435 family)